MHVHIASFGYRIHVAAGNATATHENTEQVQRVKYDHGDRYKAACELARLVGFTSECTSARA